TFFGIGDGDDHRDLSVSLSAKVDADPGVTVTAGPRIAGTPADGVPPDDVTPLAHPGGFNPPSIGSLALFVEAHNDGGGRNIDWDATVVLLSGPSPDLLINAAGQIVKAINVTVNGGQKAIGTNVNRGDGTFSVDDITNDDRGQALF